MLQFSKSPERGRCLFADRQAFRFELVWSEVPGEPDYDRMLTDYRTRLELSDNLEHAEEERHGEWIAVSGIQEGRAVTRFGKHVPSLGLMAEFVFLHLEGRDTELEQAVIHSNRETPINDGYSEWRAFGFQARIPREFPLESAKVAPANVHFKFKHPKHMEQCSIERIGLLDHWLQGSLADWFSSQHPASVKQWTVDVQHVEGIEYHLGTGMLPGTRRFGPPRHLELAAWIHPADGRLYRCRSIQQAALPPEPPWVRTLSLQPMDSLEALVS